MTKHMGMTVLAIDAVQIAVLTPTSYSCFTNPLATPSFRHHDFYA
jgi:hypothetical protein